MLAPKDKDAWHPIIELMEVVGYIVRCKSTGLTSLSVLTLWCLVYLPDEHATLLGDIEQCTFCNGRYRTVLSKFKPRAPTGALKRNDSPPPTSRPVKQESPLSKNLLLRMERAYSRKDGIAFMSAIGDINQKLEKLKTAPDGNPLLNRVKTWGGMPLELVNQIYEETYQRSAGPQVKLLTKPKSGKVTNKSETYGELNIG